jgi:hypothetical protein
LRAARRVAKRRIAANGLNPKNALAISAARPMQPNGRW